MNPYGQGQVMYPGYMGNYAHAGSSAEGKESSAGAQGTPGAGLLDANGGFSGEAAAMWQQQHAAAAAAAAAAANGQSVAVTNAGNGHGHGNGNGEVWMDEREHKRQRRKQSNRESARRSRLRKQSECEDLGGRVDALSTENATLRAELGRLKQACDALSDDNSMLNGKLLELGVPGAEKGEARKDDEVSETGEKNDELGVEVVAKQKQKGKTKGKGKDGGVEGTAA